MKTFKEFLTEGAKLSFKVPGVTQKELDRWVEDQDIVTIETATTNGMTVSIVPHMVDKISAVDRKKIQQALEDLATPIEWEFKVKGIYQKMLDSWVKKQEIATFENWYADGKTVKLQFHFNEQATAKAKKDIKTGLDVLADSVVKIFSIENRDRKGLTKEQMEGWIKHQKFAKIKSWSLDGANVTLRLDPEEFDVDLVDIQRNHRQPLGQPRG